MTPHRGGRRVSTINAQFALPEHSRAAAIAESRSRLGEHLAKKRLARLERVFAECDGRIDRGKMHHLLPADVVAHLGASGVDALFARLDADGSGAIELSEMPALMREVQALQVRMQDRCVTRRRDMTRSVARALQGGTFKLERARVRRRRSSAVHQLIATQALQAAAHAAALRSSATESHLVLVRKRSARLLKAFARADLTGDGRLSTSELAHLLPKRVSRHLGEAGTAALIERHDCDRSGTIEVAELGALLREVKVLQARLAAEDEENMAAAEANRAHRAAKAAARAAVAARARDAALTVQRTWRAVQRARDETKRIACRSIQREWRSARAMRARDAAATTIVRFFLAVSFERRATRAATVIARDMAIVTVRITARANEKRECRRLRASIRTFNGADAVAARRARVASIAAREERVREERWQHDELHARRVKERNARFAKETLRVHAEFASDLVSLRAARAAAERRERDLARAVGELRRAANERAIRKQLAEERERGHEGFGTPIPQVLVDINTTSRY